MRNRITGIILVIIALLLAVGGVALMLPAMQTGLVTAITLVGIFMLGIGAILLVFGAIGIGISIGHKPRR